MTLCFACVLVHNSTDDLSLSLLCTCTHANIFGIVFRMCTCHMRDDLSLSLVVYLSYARYNVNVFVVYLSQVHNKFGIVSRM